MKRRKQSEPGRKTGTTVTRATTFNGQATNVTTLCFGACVGVVISAGLGTLLGGATFATQNVAGALAILGFGESVKRPPQGGQHAAVDGHGTRNTSATLPCHLLSLALSSQQLDTETITEEFRRRLLCVDNPATWMKTYSQDGGDVHHKLHNGVKMSGCVDLGGLLGPSDVNSFIEHAGPGTGNRLKFIRNGTETLTTPGEVTAALLHKQYAVNRATVVIADVGPMHKEISCLSRLIEQGFGTFSSSSLYFTPPRAQGFTPHWDDHSTLMFQVMGSKAWEVWDPISGKLPKVYSDSKKARRNMHFALEELTGLRRRTFTLEEGDVLFLPRGNIHQALTNGEASMHLTSYLDDTGFTWGEALLTALSSQDTSGETSSIQSFVMRKAESDEGLFYVRAPFPTWLLNSTAEFGQHRERDTAYTTWVELVEQLAQSCNVDAACPDSTVSSIKMLTSRRMFHVGHFIFQEKLCGGQLALAPDLASLSQLDTLTADSLLLRRPLVRTCLFDMDGLNAAFVNREQFVVTGQEKKAWVFLRGQTAPFKVKDIPSKTKKQRLALARTSVVLGLTRIHLVI